MMECSIGPRQINGLSPGLRSPTEIVLTPNCSSGRMRFSPTISGCAEVPIISGTLGP